MKMAGCSLEQSVVDSAETSLREAPASKDDIFFRSSRSLSCSAAAKQFAEKSFVLAAVALSG
jgi:hypothetical protein